MAETNPSTPPETQNSRTDVVYRPEIASLPVSDSWKRKFYFIKKAGGVKLPKFKELTFGERMKINFNLLAFLFGPIYYAVKGMWKKGLTLFGVCLVAIILLSELLEQFGLGHIADSLGYGAAAIFAVRANIDYYKKEMLGENGWW